MIDLPSNFRECKCVEAGISNWNMLQRIQKMNTIQELELCFSQLRKLLK